MAEDERILSWFRIENHLNNGARPEAWPWVQWNNMEHWHEKRFELRSRMARPGLVLNNGHFLRFSNAKEWNDSINVEIYSVYQEEKITIFATTLHVQHHPDHSKLSRHWLMGEGRLLSNGQEYYLYVFRLASDEPRPQGYRRRIYLEAYKKDGDYLDHRPFNSRIIPGRGLNAIDPPSEPVGPGRGVGELLPEVVILQDDAGSGYERPPDR